MDTLTKVDNPLGSATKSFHIDGAKTSWDSECSFGKAISTSEIQSGRILA